MSQRPVNEPLSAEKLSALVDGEHDDISLAQACAAWREHAAQRSTWHVYHLIGDVMRSDDLASDGARDAAFLSRLRERLAIEPVVLAPDAAADERVAAQRAARAQRSGRWSWRASAAVAAGFVAVVGVVMVTRAPVSLPGAQPGAELAQALVPSASPLREVSAPQAASAVPAVEPQVLVANDRLIRDAQLDRYLAAHKQFSGSSVLGVPSAFLSNATSGASNR